jgi:hypothetical protein
VGQGANTFFLQIFRGVFDMVHENA